MATSGTTAFTLTRDQAITLALRKLNVLRFGATPDSTTIEQANFSLNLMLKAWQTEGIKLWTIQETTVFYVDGTTSYSLGPDTFPTPMDRPLRIIQAFIRNTSTTPNTDQYIQMLSQQEYNMLGSKFQPGMTNSIYYDPQIPNGILKVFLNPDTYTIANSELHIVYQRPIQDMVVGTDTFDLPAEWMQAIVWGLSDELSQDYQLPIERISLIALKAGKYKQELLDWDVEYTSTFFQPDYRMQYQRG